MSERYTVTADSTGLPNVASPYRALARTRYPARGTVTVDYSDGPDDIVVEIGFGEGESARSVLRMDHPGRYEIPEVLPAHETVAFRCQGVRPHAAVTITLELEPAAA